MKISDIEVSLIDIMGSDLSVVNAARVSFDKESKLEVFVVPASKGYFTQELRLSDKDAKLINYLAKHKHTSPFAHTFASFRIKAPIFVARQLVKHEYMPWNEVSRRYVDSEPEFYIPAVFRSKAENVKQGSGGELNNNTFWREEFEEASGAALHWYLAALEHGMCPEQARMVLPQNTMTEWYWSGTVSAFGKMLSLRLDSHTQKETRDVAEKIYEQLLPHFPVSLKAFVENV